MKIIPIIFLWKFGFFINFIQCEINTTIHLLFPLIFSQSQQNAPLSEQAIYDLKNTLRLSKEMNDFDDDDEDYNEDESIENENQLIEFSESTTTIITTTTTSLNILKSSSFYSKMNSIHLLLLLLILSQTNTFVYVI